MTEKITFFLPGRPRPKNQRHAGRNGRIYADPKQKAHQWELATLAKPRGPEEPFAGPVSLSLDFIFEPPKRPREIQGLGLPHIQKPDADNLAKMIKDALSLAGFWVDDCQVFDLQITKKWGTPPGTLVTVQHEQKNDL